MKILFICGSLEPGRDGVGDYTTKLAAALQLKGIRAAIIAINDHFVQQPISGCVFSQGAAITTYRHPSSQSLSSNKQLVYNWINSFSPDYISLQFVPFAFHSKGLPFGLPALLKYFVARKPLHIMFHELWVGMNVNSPAKEKLWGFLQKRLIKSMVKALDPVCVHTQTPLYQLQLSRLPIPARLLPLFGNIAINKDVKAGSELEGAPPIRMVIFGAIHPDSPIHEFAKEAAGYAESKGLTMSLSLVGRCGGQQNAVISSFQENGIAVKVYGEQPPEIISGILSASTLGLTTTPLLLVQKSGSVAAMAEHGLPVVCLPKKWETTLPHNLTAPGYIIEYRQGQVNKCFESRRPVGLPQNSVSKIASLMMECLPLSAHSMQHQPQ